jgi:predicted Zn-dependent protease with MMP-like domain
MSRDGGENGAVDLVDRAHQALDGGDRRRARRLLKSIESKPRKPDRAMDVAFLRWRLASLASDLDNALAIARENAKAWPDSPDLQHALGWTLLESGLTEEALPWLEEACYLDANFADAWYELAQVRGALGDTAGMRQAYAEVFSIDTAPPMPPLQFSEDRAAEWAQKAYDALPEHILDRVGDVPVIIADYPEDWILEAAPWDPRLLGLFVGPTWAEAKSLSLDTIDAGGLLIERPVVYIFQRNLERVVSDPRDMAREVRITVHHELGHYLGLDEDDLAERGLA